ncbi:hypothetical protein [Pedobacter miscanthi]|uniref:hypothetical protein n=1 Tax=Pedobacter miscanthi TaxID=2259170 RepID=UPI0029308F66|nr:hypothetical protein [Pedobacter miscanthi]
MATLTKKELKVLKEFGDNPNYRIETNSRNQIVAVPVKPDNSMERFEAGQEFKLNKNASFFTNIIYRFDPSTGVVTNNEGVDAMKIIAAYRDGFIVGRTGRESRIINFSDVTFNDHD